MKTFKLKIVFYSFLWILLALNTCLIASTDSQESAEQVMNKFLHYLKKQSYLESYTLTSPSFQRGTTEKQFQGYIENYSFFVKFQDYQILKQKENLLKASFKVIFDPKTQPKEVLFFLTNDHGWRIQNFEIVDQSENAPQIDARVLFDAFYQQLKAIQDADNEKAYAYFSKHYQEEYSYQDFLKFIKLYPIFQNFENFDIQSPRLDSKQGTFFVNLKNTQQSYHFQYVLIPEGGQWKIDSIRFVEQIDISSSNQTEKFNQKLQELEATHFDVNPLKQLLQTLLDSLKNKDVKQVYTNLTSTHFRKETSFQNFESFIQRHPILFHFDSWKYVDLSFNNNAIIFTLNLIDKDKNVYPMIVELAKDGDAWKIQNINIESSHKPKPLEGLTTTSIDSKGMSFTKVLIGYEVDKSGLVKNPKSILEAQNSKEIFVNVFVQQGRKDVVVRMVLKNVDNEGFVPPISTTLNSDGDSVITFVFSAPREGWPTGNYELKLSSSAGLLQIFNFRME